VVGEHVREGARHRDPESFKVQFTTSAKAFGAGKNLYRGPITTTASTSPTIRRSPRSPARSRCTAGPRGPHHRRDARLFPVDANRDKEWAWKLLPVSRGRSKDGELSQAYWLAKDAMLGSGYQSVMKSDAIKAAWKPWGDPDAIMAIWEKASLHRQRSRRRSTSPGTLPWTDQLNIEVQKCLTGQITADQCCDNLIKGIADAKRKT